jgi:hypothetical protein
VRKAPEVVVKVSGGGRNLAVIKAHLGYISRHGKLECEFRGMPITDSEGSRSPIPIHADHRFRAKPIT